MSHLVNPLATASQLLQRPSLSPLPPDVDECVFMAAQCLTQAAGQLMRYPQSLTAQANVLLARFWLVESPMAHEFSDVSAAVVYLVGKLGPKPRPPRDVANVYAYLLSRRSALFAAGGDDDARSYYRTDAEYLSFAARIMALEARILGALSYDTHVTLPHALAITYLQTLALGAEAPARVVQYLNTALLSPQVLYLTHQPHALAVAAIYNAARDLGARMPECAWWEVYDVDREELGFLVVAMRSLDGWLRRRRQELPRLAGGIMPTRRQVGDEMRARGLRVGAQEQADGREDETMRAMDLRC